MLISDAYRPSQEAVLTR